MLGTLKHIRWKNASAGYGLPAVVLHWLMLLLIAAAYALMEFKSAFPKGSSGREAMAAWHYAAGLSVFFLVWLRLFLRLPGSEPVIKPPLPAWQIKTARLVHWALYGLMIALPLVGWLLLNADGKAVTFFGATLPTLFPQSEFFGEAFEEIHEALGTAGYFLIGAHAGAALFHHYVLRDNTLRLIWLRNAESPDSGQ